MLEINWSGKQTVPWKKSKSFQVTWTLVLVRHKQILPMETTTNAKYRYCNREGRGNDDNILQSFLQAYVQHFLVHAKQRAEEYTTCLQELHSHQQDDCLVKKMIWHVRTEKTMHCQTGVLWNMKSYNVPCTRCSKSIYVYLSKRENTILHENRIYPKGQARASRKFDYVIIIPSSAPRSVSWHKSADSWAGSRRNRYGKDGWNCFILQASCKE